MDIARHVFRIFLPAFALLPLILTPAFAEVKIIYPFAGANLPQTDPPPGSLSSYHATISFMAVCPEGQHSLRWLINNQQLGELEFYDQVTVQFTYKLEGGGHHLKVESDERCGYDEIKFIVGP